MTMKKLIKWTLNHVPRLLSYSYCVTGISKPADFSE